MRGTEHLRALEDLTSLSLGLGDASVPLASLLGPSVTHLGLFFVPTDTDLSVLTSHPVIDTVLFWQTDMVELLRNRGPVPLRHGTLLLDGDCRVPDDPATLLPPGSEATVEVRVHSPS
jgi:hypothetical protein